MPRPLIEPGYKRKEIDFLKELYGRITLNEITERYLWENKLHIYFIGVKLPFVLPEKYRVRLKRKDSIPGFPVDIVFHPDGDLILKETRYDKNSEEVYLTNPILFVTNGVNFNDRIFKYLFMDDISIHKKDGREIIISESQCEGRDKDLYNFNYGALVCELNMDQLYYFITGNNPGKHNEINYNSNEIASYKNLILHEDGTLTVGVFPICNFRIESKQYIFLKELINLKSQEFYDSEVPKERFDALIKNGFVLHDLKEKINQKIKSQQNPYKIRGYKKYNIIEINPANN